MVILNISIKKRIIKIHLLSLMGSNIKNSFNDKDMCDSKRKEGKLSYNINYRDVSITILLGLPEEIEA
jgi:hypothetical protein